MIFDFDLWHSIIKYDQNVNKKLTHKVFKIINNTLENVGQTRNI